MKTIIQYILKIIAKRIYLKYKPEVIGITGSVGKTSARKAVYAVMKEKHEVRSSIKNYNNEIGLPLTLIDEESRGQDLFGWISVFLKGISLIRKRDKNYPKVLVLEMGADKPGDIEYLLKIVKCKIGIITRIGESHLEAFKTVDRIKKEKALIVKELEKNDWAVLNFDDDRVREIAKEVKSNYISYGLNEKSDLYASDVSIVNQVAGGGKDQYGLSFKMHYKGSVVPVNIPGVISFSSVYACLVGASVGIIYGLNLIEIAGALKNYKSPKGRMNMILGVKGTLILDDTYNASPQSSVEALEALVKLELSGQSHSYAVFGDMLELGDYTEAGHREVGERLAELKINYLITSGERSRDIGHGARQAGMSEDNIFHFDDNSIAGKFLEDRIKKGDIILVKGSQGARMERVVKEIMADPLHANDLLVRQSPEWDS